MATEWTHARETDSVGTLILRSPMISMRPALGAPRPRAPMSRPPMPRPPAMTVPSFAPPRVMMPPPAPTAWRARALMGCIGGMAFGAALLAVFFYLHTHASTPPPAAPLFAERAAPPAPLAPPVLAAPATTNASEPAPAPKPKPAPPQPAASHATSGAQVSFAVAAPPPEKKKTAKDQSVDELLEKLGEEQLKR
ncbi:MAG TPA: hypothetical protein VIF62_22495 [Labilithrix sp.]